MDKLIIKGARTNNLKGINVEFPLNKISCVVGKSGSGKSSLVFHTIANESKRRFLNSSPTGFTFFDKVPQSAEVEFISPVLPVWILPQHNPIMGSRLTISDQIEVSVDLAQLYTPVDTNFCNIHFEKFVDEQSLLLNKIEEVITSDKDVIHFLLDGSLYRENISGFPVRSLNLESKNISDFNAEDDYWEIFRIKGKSLSDVPKKLAEFKFIKDKKYQIAFYNLNNGVLNYFQFSGDTFCQSCKDERLLPLRRVDELLPFNGVGACSTCGGHGSTLDYNFDKLVKYPSLSIKSGAVSILKYAKFSDYHKLYSAEVKKEGISLDDPFESLPKIASQILLEGQGRFPGVNQLLKWLEEKRYKSSVRIFLRSLQSESLCSSCHGARISERAARIKVSKDLPSYKEMLLMPIHQVLGVVKSISSIAKPILVAKIVNKLELACEFGLGDFHLSKKLKELDSNEYQKSLLIRYLTYRGSGSLFVLDEPSLGLNLDEQKVLVKYLKKLSESNTVLIVDHSEYLKKSSDYIVEVGPGAGDLGGEIVYQGPYQKTFEQKIKVEKLINKIDAKDIITVNGISFSNDHFKKILIPKNTVNRLVGKRDSYLRNIVVDCILNELNYKLTNEKNNIDAKYQIKSFSNIDDIEEVVIYESNIERFSGRSTVGTMLGLTPIIRKHFANLHVSKALGLKDGHFSSNSDLGKCPTCDGKGIIEIDMHFMEDVILPCDECGGKKLNKFYANISDGRMTIFESLNKPIREVFDGLKLTPKTKRLLEYLELLNLNYLSLDRTLPSLSGGERLRVKFLNTLQSDIQNSILYFTNISYGLSASEIVRIRELLVSLSHKNNTILLVDNHPLFNDFNQIDFGP